jgi:nitrogenase molybdenum-iron protein alpha chain
MQEREKILDNYTAKVFKNRKDHIVQLEESGVSQEIAANSRSVPGMMINRGCCYAGCKGVVLGPLRDVVTITHGPVGCGFYSWGTRRNKANNPDGRNFIQYCFTTDMQESDIVFGGEKKLKQAIKEAVELFHPECILICSTCPIGLIGDDIQAVATWAQEIFKIQCVAFSCEGYRGVSQSAGHHIANNGLMKHIIGTGNAVAHAGKHTVNILGEYNIGGDGWETSRVLKRIGYEVLNVFTGDGSYEGIKDSHTADLNLVMCHRSINYIAEMMKTKYGIDWLKVNCIGIAETIRSLREMALYFNDPVISAKTEEVIAEEYAAIAGDLEFYKEKLAGKTAGIFVGGSRTHHYQSLLKELGVKTVIGGYEFAHRDDYEGRDVLADIKLDADSKNIEEITVAKDETKYRLVINQERFEELKDKIALEEYKGMFRDMDAGTITVDDFNHYETEKLIEIFKPDIFYSGIKDKYMLVKAGTPSRQLHSYDYSGPYSCFQGALNFARDSYMAIYAPAWGLIAAPWKTTSTLMGKIGGAQ